MKNICVGVVAHVDSGKTTLSENILYRTGHIRSMGRVDHGNTFLDTYGLERQRGITIFSKQARFQLGDKAYTLLDTPGHVDFSAEMERSLQVLDYAVLVVSGSAGVQAHTVTLWKLLERYNVPLFVFVNKMDQVGADREKLMDELRSHLGGSCIDMLCVDQEELALGDEHIMEYYLEHGTVLESHIIQMIRERKLVPCYFGSALKDEGVEKLLEAIEAYTDEPDYGEEFGARVYKITRDNQGNRLTHMKVTGGVLRVKDFIDDEKVDQIRLYSGEKYTTVSEVYPGQVCAVTGLTKTAAGYGIGCETNFIEPYLQPVLTYKLILPEGVDTHSFIRSLRELEEEEPELHILWNEQFSEIHARVMGEIEIEILKSLILDRFGIEVEFGSGSIVYKETIENVVEGVGHYEPLKHYAEVHLKLEPGERGSGLQFEVDCNEDKLAKNWQRLVLTHLEEKAHKGVLTGSEITDMKITLIAGKAHLKHTEGGDFRQATYRAIRHGLRRAQSVLLEPVYEFRLEIPQGCVGRALTDIQRMNGRSELPDVEGDMAIITGVGPVATMNDYQRELVAYTGGKGRLYLAVKGYEPCHNQEEIIEKINYDAEGDLDNPTGSVFCAHGAGFVVNWQDVEQYMHIPPVLCRELGDGLTTDGVVDGGFKENNIASAEVYDPNELEKIFERTYGPIDRSKAIHHNRDYERLEAERERLRRAEERKVEAAIEKYKERHSRPKSEQARYLLVDGYNIIFAWEELKALAETNLDAARTRLMDIMCNYQGYKGYVVIVVFDAYKVQGNKGEVQKYNNIHVIYTKEAETADQYIEKAVHEIGKKYDVTVATSDSLVQMIIWGEGAKRLSAAELEADIRAVSKELRDNYVASVDKKTKFTTIGDILSKK